jgi:t-SNARE complex subunit (syntaxin)
MSRKNRIESYLYITIIATVVVVILLAGMSLD